MATEDVYDMYTFSKCCSHLSEDFSVNITTVIGSVSLELYRGPSQHNTPKFNERTLEVSLGLWFLFMIWLDGTKSQNAPSNKMVVTTCYKMEWYKIRSPKKWPEINGYAWGPISPRSRWSESYFTLVMSLGFLGPNLPGIEGFFTWKFWPLIFDISAYRPKKKHRNQNCRWGGRIPPQWVVFRKFFKRIPLKCLKHSGLGIIVTLHRSACL